MQSTLLKLVYRALDPVVAILHALRITPNMVTAFSLVLSAIAALSLATGHAFLSIGFLIIAGLCDVIDGHLARKTNTSSPAGAFVDSFVDRISDGLILVGIAFLGFESSLSLSVAALLSVLAAFSVSYARARGESLGVSVTAGPMKRPARFILQTVLVFGFAILRLGSEPLAFQFLTGGMWIFLILTFFTAGQRARHAMAALSGN